MSTHANKQEVVSKYVDPTTNLILDTLAKNKQALVFVSSKRAAEKVATDIAKKIKLITQEKLAEKIVNCFSTPTEQCLKLGDAVKKGIAFHHAGLDSKQKELIEDHFREGSIKIIACTPTLAAGLDMPAFRTIIRDLKRYSNWGMQYIPVLEYEQMAGRAGRPGHEEYGEAICIAANKREADNILLKFIQAEVEPIYSKLAVEPVLRTYVLSLVASEFITSKKELINFFSKSFWAYQYQDIKKLEQIINRVIDMLKSYDFLESSAQQNGFTSGADLLNDQLKATPLGTRTAQLYLDPLTAHHIVEHMRLATTPTNFATLQLLANTLEMRPFASTKKREYEAVEEQIDKYEPELLQKPPSLYDHEYTDYVNAFKLTLCLRDWIDEAGEDLILERYDIRPGELKAKKDIMEWLLTCTTELLKVQNIKAPLGQLYQLQQQVIHGAKSELLPLLRLKGIGRKRARVLYAQQINSPGSIRTVSLEQLSQIIGKKLAISLKEQVNVTTFDFASLDENKP